MAAIYDVHAPAASVEENQDGSAREVEFDHGLADREPVESRRGLGDDPAW